MPKYFKYKEVYNFFLYGRNEINRLPNTGDATISSERMEQIAVSTTPYITNTYSQYYNSHIYRFNLNQQFKNIAQNSKLILLYARVPGLNQSSIHRTIRLCGAEGTNCWDSERGFSSNPILCVYGEGGTTDQNFFNTDPTFSGIEIPPNFLSKGYIEFELCTIALNGHIGFTGAELDDFCVNFIIYEPDMIETNDINLAPEVNTKSLGYITNVPTFK